MMQLLVSSLIVVGVLSSIKLVTKSTINVGKPESCEYDSNMDYWYFNNQVNHTVQTYSAAGERDVSKTFSDSLLNSPAGMVANGNYLYVASFHLGYVIEFNTTSTLKVRSFAITGHNPNGLCLDTTSNLLYVTDAGLDVDTFSPNDLNGMWSINLTDGTINTIFDNTDNYYPNGCAIKSDDHSIYVVQTNIDTVGNNKILIINSTSWDINEATGVLGDWNVTADGIVFDNDGNIYVTSWGNFSTGGGYINVYNGDSWSTAIADLSGPADIGYDATNDRICIPNSLSSIGLITDISDDSTTSSSSNINPIISLFMIIFATILLLC